MRDAINSNKMHAMRWQLLALRQTPHSWLRRCHTYNSSTNVFCTGTLLYRSLHPIQIQLNPYRRPQLSARIVKSTYIELGLL